MFGILARSEYCFNLSILECKCVHTPRGHQPRAGFNLSILECKFFSAQCMCARRCRFNLSILECKSKSLGFGTQGSHVLIYPYWNVNLPVSVKFAVIEPRFNLSILECKLFFIFLPHFTRCSFNLSILECKCISSMIYYILSRF